MTKITLPSMKVMNATRFYHRQGGGSMVLPTRISCDKIVNAHGRVLPDCFISSDLKIVNGGLGRGPSNCRVLPWWH